MSEEAHGLRRIRLSDEVEILKGPPEATIQTAVGYGLQHADLAGYLQRVVENRQHCSGKEPGVGGALGGGGEEDVGRRTVTAVRFEVMLHGADSGLAKFVARIDQA